MDKEIEELLHALNIQTDFSTQQAPVKEIPFEKEKSQQPRNETPFVLDSLTLPPNKQPSRPFYVWVGAGLLVLGLSSLSAWGCAYFLLKKEPLPPLRMVESPHASYPVFFNHQKVRPYRLTLEPIQRKASQVDSEMFFQKVPYDEELFTEELENNQQFLQQHKNELVTSLNRAGVLTERESLRALSRNFDDYLRSQLQTSALLEEQAREKGESKRGDEKKAWHLYMNLFGGLPLKGCIPSVQEGSLMRKKLSETMDALVKESSLERQAFLAMQMLKCLEKLSQDRLLSSLIDGKEERKKLDDAIIAILLPFEKQRDRTKEYTVQEWRALGFLKWCLSKKASFDWEKVDQMLVHKSKSLSLEEYNTLTSGTGTFLGSAKRIDW